MSIKNSNRYILLIGSFDSLKRENPPSVSYEHNMTSAMYSPVKDAYLLGLLCMCLSWEDHQGIIFHSETTATTRYDNGSGLCKLLLCQLFIFATGSAIVGLKLCQVRWNHRERSRWGNNGGLAFCDRAL